MPEPLDISPLIREVKANNDFTLTVNFNNGETKQFDLKPHLDKNLFKELQDLNYFKQVKANAQFVEWPHSQDLSRDTLYLEGIS
jgi:hypothetical protein